MKDLFIGQKFGKWEVLRREKNSKHNNKMYLCRCDCGKTSIVAKTSLINNKSRACRSCAQIKTEDLKIGQKFERWTILKKITATKFLCKCDCGKIKQITKTHLLDGVSKSCGCLRSEKLKARPTHHKTNTRIYQTYASMKDRCFNKKNKNFNLYGGRGITVCDEWKNDFVAFYNWAMANGYKDNLTIDRINNDGNYEPSNCRWTTRKQQANNTRKNNFIKYKGETHTISEWSNILKIDHRKIQSRLKRNRNNLERVFFKGNLSNNGVGFCE